MKYDFFTLYLLNELQRYIPVMTPQEVYSILTGAFIPSPWEIRDWEAKREKAMGSVERAVNKAISRQNSAKNRKKTASK